MEGRNRMTNTLSDNHRLALMLNLNTNSATQGSLTNFKGMNLRNIRVLMVSLFRTFNNRTTRLAAARRAYRIVNSSVLIQGCSSTLSLSLLSSPSTPSTLSFKHSQHSQHSLQLSSTLDVSSYSIATSSQHVAELQVATSLWQGLSSDSTETLTLRSAFVEA